MFLFNNDKILLAYIFLNELKRGHLISCKLEYCLQSKCLSRVVSGSVMEVFMVGVMEGRPCTVLLGKLCKTLY